MNSERGKWVLRLRDLAARAAFLALVAGAWLSASPVVLAAKKKAEEAAPTKSYVFPYMIVLFLVGLGIMTVCRPGNRKDRAEERKDEEE